MYANHKSLRYDISRVLDPIYQMSPGSRVPAPTYDMGPGSQVSGPTESPGSQFPFFGRALSISHPPP